MGLHFQGGFLHGYRQKKKINKPLLYDLKATDIVGDQEGNLWVSTIGNDLLFIPNEDLIRIPFKSVNPSKNTNFTCLAKDNQGHIFVGTGDGNVLEINRNNEHIMTYTSQEDREIEFIKAKNNKLYTSRGIFEKTNPIIQSAFYLGKDISEDAYGNFLVGSYNLTGIIAQELGKSPKLPPFLVGKYPSSKYSIFE